MVELCCVSVPGGWQTCVKGTEVAFGPVFNVIGDLWKWQRKNIFTNKVVN